MTAGRRAPAAHARRPPPYFVSRGLSPILRLDALRRCTQVSGRGTCAGASFGRLGVHAIREIPICMHAGSLRAGPDPTPVR